MKIALISDLHLHRDEVVNMVSHLGERLDEIKPDVILNAGDFGNTFSTQTMQQVNGVCRTIAGTLFVYGNHDYYLNNESRPEDSTFNFNISDDVVFIWGTLWTNYFGGDPYQKMASERGLSDFRFIPGWTTERQINCFNNSMRMLEDTVKHYADKKIVILSHHAPSTLCVHPRFAGDALNGSFVNKLEDFILDHPQIKVWCHGHVHDDVDAMIGETRILCHPRGYRHEVNYSNYEPKVFEV